MYFVYILKSVTKGIYYIGCTDNIDRRIKEHNKGYSKYTKNKRPWIVCYIEDFGTLAEARKREKLVKSWKKRSAIEKLIKTAPIV